MDKVLHSSYSEEHYTPQWLLSMAVNVMGAIDLDPCADPGLRVPARKHYVVIDNGLSQPWHGRVWCNPPYGDECPRWIKMLENQWNTGHVSQALLLTAARTDTQWFKPLYDHAICFVEGRICFLDEDYMEQDPAPFPSAITYWCPYDEAVARFVRVFSRIGACVVRA